MKEIKTPDTDSLAITNLNALRLEHPPNDFYD